MDFNLTEQEKMLQNLAKDFAENEVKPKAAEIDRTNQFPFALSKRIGALGFQGLPYPEKYGGGGAGYLSFALALEQVCKASVSVGAIMSVNTVPEEGIFRYGTEEQKQRLLVPLAKGTKLAGIGFTEPDTGSDPTLVTTRAKRTDKGWVINGQKMFMSLAPVLDYVLLFAKNENNSINAFIVDGKAPGFSVQEVLDVMGMRGFGTSIVNLDNVFVPEENLIGAPGEGFSILLEAISIERMAVAVQAVAIAQSALELSIDYAKQRKAQGKPIARMQSVQQELAEMAARTEASRWLTYKTAFLRDQGLSIQYDGSLAKIFASSVAVEVTRMAMQIHGSFGAIKTLPIERLYRDAKITEMYVGTTEVHRSIVANKLIR
jgi:butyryl-CoA dehydrogenase